MTPQDILNKRFDKGMGGYKVEDVNAFLIEVGDYVESLLEEKAELVTKLEVLAERVEEYRADEDSLRAALIGAQKLGDSVVRESKKKAEEILAEADRQANGIVSKAKKDLANEALTLKQIQSEVKAFRKQILDMYERQFEVIKSLPRMEAPKLGEVEQPVFAADPEPVSEIPVQEAEPEVFTLQFDDSGDPEDPEEAGAKKSRFGKLQFGEEFSLTREE